MRQKPAQAGHKDFAPVGWALSVAGGGKHLGTEATECLVSLLLEPYPELVDALAECMDANESSAEFVIDGSRSVGEIRALLVRVVFLDEPRKL